jgi:hypothetical protein
MHSGISTNQAYDRPSLFCDVRRNRLVTGVQLRMYAVSTSPKSEGLNYTVEEAWDLAITGLILWNRLPLTCTCACLLVV